MKKLIHLLTTMFIIAMTMVSVPASYAENTLSDTLSIEPAERPELKVYPAEVVLGNIERNTKKDISVTIRNTGKADLEWQAVSKVSWLTLKRKVSEKDFMLRDVPGYQKTLYGTGKAEIAIRIDTKNLADGKYKGEILISSNGGKEKILLSMNVVTLESLSISPVSIKIGVGQKRTFRVIGIWSDGSRTDLSKSFDGEWVSSDPLIGTVDPRKSVFLAQKTGRVELSRIRGDMRSNSASVVVEEFIKEPVLLISPREINLELIGLGERVGGAYSLKNVGSRKLYWRTNGPEGWTSLDRGSLEGIIDNDIDHLQLSVETQRVESSDNRPYKGLHTVIIKIGTGPGDYVSYRKKLPLGSYRERIVLTSNGGTRNLFFKFGITESLSRPRLETRPEGIDFGTIDAGKKIMKKLEVRNTGKGILNWRVKLQGWGKIFNGVILKKGKYVSFLNENIRGMNVYKVPGSLLEHVEITGIWTENEGYPVSNYADGQFAYKFRGTGISLFVTKEKDGGIIAASIDGTGISTFDCKSEGKERAEFPIATKLTEGDHILTLKNMGGIVTLEGVRVYDNDLVTEKSGWIKLFPDRGTTEGEVDYINVMIDSGKLSPGSYCENVLFYSNGGNRVAELSLEVTGPDRSGLIDIYRYIKGDDNILTSNTEPIEGYKRGKTVVFKLFRKDTPGTIEFYEWYNPAKGDHFYSTDRSGEGKSLIGYDFVGSIGNIATVKLSDTRELFKWFNPDKGTHFYTTDPKGEGRTGEGYKYDGISGYVR